MTIDVQGSKASVLSFNGHHLAKTHDQLLVALEVLESTIPVPGSPSREGRGALRTGNQTRESRFTDSPSLTCAPSEMGVDPC